MQSEMQQRQMIMIERLQDVNDETKPSPPASDSKAQIADSARAENRSVSPSEQLSGNFDEFQT